LKRNGDGRLFDLERPRLFLVGELAPALGGTQHHLTVARPEGLFGEALALDRAVPEKFCFGRYGNRAARGGEGVDLLVSVTKLPNRITPSRR
jgi:hypothetical protein